MTLLERIYQSKSKHETRALYKSRFSTWFKELRQNKPLLDLAEKLNLSRQYIHSMERQNNLPTPETALKVGHVLNVDPLEFQLKAGSIPLELVYELGWQYYPKFKNFLASLD